MTEIRHIVFDIGKVLIHYDPHLAFLDILPDADERQWFLTHICTSAWNLEQDRGRRWADAEEELIERWRTFEGLPQKMNLPSAPHPFLQYFEEDNRPQTRLDRDFERGMGISLGRLRGDSLFDWRFVGLSHNTLRGAAGGAVLIAELLCAQGYIPKK